MSIYTPLLLALGIHDQIPLHDLPAHFLFQSHFIPAVVGHFLLDEVVVGVVLGQGHFHQMK